MADGEHLKRLRKSAKAADNGEGASLKGLSCEERRSLLATQPKELTMDAEATRAEDAPSGPTDAFHLNCPNCDAAIDLIPSTRPAEPDLRAVLEAGTPSMTKNQVIIDFDTRDDAEAMFAALNASASQENG